MSTKCEDWEELLGDGIVSKTITEGVGLQPEVGHIVEYSYTGKLSDESNFSIKQFERTRIGDGDEIPGLELALRNMKPGETRIVKCAARFAYSDRGQSVAMTGIKEVPPNSDVTFILKYDLLVSSKQITEMSNEEKLNFSIFKKAIGNKHFSESLYSKALQCYRCALDASQSVLSSNAESEVLAKSKDLVLACTNNITATYIKLSNLSAALESTVDALTIDPNNVKALYRAGQISSKKGDFAEAKIALKKALELDPNNNDVRTEIRKLKIKIAEFNSRNQEMMVKMSSGLVQKAKEADDSFSDSETISSMSKKRKKSIISYLLTSVCAVVLIALVSIAMHYFMNVKL